MLYHVQMTMPCGTIKQQLPPMDKYDITSKDSIQEYATQLEEKFANSGAAVDVEVVELI